MARRSAALAQCGVLLCTHPKHPSLLTHFSCLLLSWLYINRAHMMVVGALCTVITDNLSAIAMLCQHSVSVFCVCVEVHAAVSLAKTPCVLRARRRLPLLPAGGAAQWGAAIASCGAYYYSRPKNSITYLWLSSISKTQCLMSLTQKLKRRKKTTKKRKKAENNMAPSSSSYTPPRPLEINEKN